MGEPVGAGGVVERAAVLVADPLLVDLGVVAGQSRRITLPRRWSTRIAEPQASCSATAGRGDQVERAGAEAVLGAGERADRADLDRVAGEVGLERLLLVDADLLQRAALDQRDERVAGDLLGEAGAARAEHAALAVEQHLRGDVDRLREGALDPPDSANRDSPRPLDIAWFCSGHSPPLSQTGQSSGWLISRNSMIPAAPCRRPGGGLGVHDHALGDRERAGGLRLRAAAVAGVGDVDQALAAGADRVEQRVVAEPRDLDADLLGGADHQGVPWGR